MGNHVGKVLLVSGVECTDCHPIHRHAVSTATRETQHKMPIPTLQRNYTPKERVSGAYRDALPFCKVLKVMLRLGCLVQNRAETMPAVRLSW